MDARVEIPRRDVDVSRLRAEGLKAIDEPAMLMLEMSSVESTSCCLFAGIFWLRWLLLVAWCCVGADNETGNPTSL